MAGDPPILAGLKHIHNQVLTIVSDLTPEQFAYRPGGTANPIGPTLHHIIATHDRIINEFIQGRDTQWVRGNWADKLGLPSTHRLEPDLAEFERFDFTAYRPYIDAVYEEALATIPTIGPADLDREVPGFRGPVRLGDLIGRTLLLHIATHLGEIAAVKGLQGLKGLP